MDITCNQLTDFLFAKAGAEGLPLAGSFELTPRCTLNCKMCYIHKSSHNKSAAAEEKDAAFWLDLASKAKDAGMLMLLLTGGEPMLRPDFDEIYRECKRLGLLVSVNTNATLIDDDKLRLFAEYPPHKVNVTLYGASPSTYGRLCGNASAYQKVVDSVRELKSAGVNLQLNYSITPDNVGDIPAAAAFCKALDVPVVAASYMFGGVRDCGEAYRLTAGDAAQAKLDWQRELLGDDELAARLRADLPLEVSGEECRRQINCRAGLSTFWVTWRGEMTPCGMMSGPCVPAADFAAAWAAMRKAREGIYLPPKCTACGLQKKCDMCAAVSLGETGSSDGVPPYACQKAHDYARLCDEFISRQ